MQSTFLEKDVKALLKDITGTVEPLDVEKREKLISSGEKPYNLIPKEPLPSKCELEIYEQAIQISGIETATAIKKVAEKIYSIKGSDVVLVSLARGGITSGILIKRYLEKKYKIRIQHFAITLIGKMGIDERALQFILKKAEPSRIQFIDGWTGKGAIIRALKNAVAKYDNLSSELAVLCDPANLTYMCGTHKDILVPACVLNAPLTGLISRAIPREKESFFGAVYFENMAKVDKTYDYIERIERNFDFSDKLLKDDVNDNGSGLCEIEKIALNFKISDIHFIKPGMGETLRALIRKKPDIILVNNEGNQYTDFIRKIAQQNDITINEYALANYNACGIYKNQYSDVL